LAHKAGEFGEITRNNGCLPYLMDLLHDLVTGKLIWFAILIYFDIDVTLILTLKVS